MLVVRACPAISASRGSHSCLDANKVGSLRMSNQLCRRPVENRTWWSSSTCSLQTLGVTRQVTLAMSHWHRCRVYWSMLDEELADDVDRARLLEILSPRKNFAAVVSVCWKWETVHQRKTATMPACCAHQLTHVQVLFHSTSRATRASHHPSNRKVSTSRHIYAATLRLVRTTTTLPLVRNLFPRP